MAENTESVLKVFGYKIFKAFATGFLLLISLGSIAAGPVPVFDSHSHYKAEDALAYEPQAIIEMMDRANITHMVIVGEPAELAQSLYRYAPERIIPFLGLYDKVEDKSNWIENDALAENLENKLQQGFYRGIGEIHLFKEHRKHDNLKKVIRLAEKYQLPVLFHGDAEVVEQIFNISPDLTIIWAHLGTDPSPVLLSGMLDRYPEKLYIDTSVRDERIMANGKLLPQWREFFIEHENRILVAIDTFYTPRWQNIDAVVGQIRQWLSFLPRSVRERLAYKNAAELFANN